MTTTQEVFRAVSTNGRYGLAVVADTKINFPAKGKLTLLGTFEGIKTFKFAADENGQWIYVGGDLVPIAGAATVESEALQSGNHATIVAGGEFFVIKEYGYMRRRSEILAFRNGTKINLPATVMAAMGLIPAENKPVVVEIPAIDSPIAEALRKAGIVQHTRAALSCPHKNKFKEKKMKKYDFAKAHDFIEAEKESLAEASLGMHEDWFWTAETIWENGEYAVNLATVAKIAGICGSSWATPVIKLEYNDGKERFLECYKGESSGTKPDFLELGVLSGPAQDSIAPIEK